MFGEKISVIIPVYNAAAYITKCLDSVINQSYKNLEIICVNDGSTDESGSILESYAFQDSRVRVFHQKNGSSARARNTGLDAATGDWITFADNDDWLDLDMYEKLMLYGDNNPADILACGYYFDYPDREIEAINKLPVPEGAQNIKSFLYYIYCRDEYKGVSSYIWNKLFRADWFNGTIDRIRIDVSYGNLGDDLDLAAKCYMHAKTIAYLSESKYHHRERLDSVFHSFDQRLETMQHIRAYENMISLYEKNHIDDHTMDYIKRFYVYHLGVLM